jgi:hypothetical protein
MIRGIAELAFSLVRDANGKLFWRSRHSRKLQRAQELMNRGAAREAEGNIRGGVDNYIKALNTATSLASELSSGWIRSQSIRPEAVDVLTKQAVSLETWWKSVGGTLSQKSTSRHGADESH